MPPLDFQPKKHLTSGAEEVLYSYSPSFGGAVVDDPNIIDLMILNSLKSGIPFSHIRINITNKRVLFDLAISSFSQQLEMCYQDIRSIEVGESWGSPCAFHDRRGLSVWLNASRPHFVAIELWVAIAAQVQACYYNLGRIREGYSLISAIGVNTLKVPDDFLSIKGEQYSAACAVAGFCLPINKPPYWRLSSEMISHKIISEPTTTTYISESINLDSPPSGTLTASSKKSGVTSATANVVSNGAIDTPAGSVPVFQPSAAEIPKMILRMETVEQELLFAIHNSPAYFQTFYNDLSPLTPKGFDDDIISANCFDEDLYCALVREMHRYTLAEISANQDQIAKTNAGLGAMVGSFLGLITGNIFAPFLGHTYGKNITDRSRRIEDFLPDPKLLFNQDANSFLSWSRGQVSSPRLRRLIIDRQTDREGMVYFRLVPAIVTADSVYPIQLFKLGTSSYFYRPLAAGIGDDEGRRQPSYDPVKIQRKYFHIRAEGEVRPTNISLLVYGRDIEDYRVKLSRYIGHSLDYFYADFKIQPGSVF